MKSMSPNSSYYFFVLRENNSFGTGAINLFHTMVHQERISNPSLLFVYLIEVVILIYYLVVAVPHDLCILR